LMSTPHTSQASFYLRHKNSFFITVGLLVALALVGLWFSVKAKATSQPANQTLTPALSVTRSIAKHELWPTKIEVPGAILARREALIGAPQNGLRLIEINAEVGDQVKKGQQLARFDTRQLQAEEAQLRATLTQNEAIANQAEANYQRALLLRDSGGLSEQDILLAKTNAISSSAQVEFVKGQLAAKQVQLQYAEVLAPDDGVVSLSNAILGAVSTNAGELFRIIRQNRLEWRGELTATQSAQIEVGQNILLDLPDGSTTTAKVRQVAPTLDNQSRLGTVYADIESGSKPRSGMYAFGRIILKQNEALVVPAVSVVIRDGRSYIFTLNNSQELSTVSLQAVTTGRRQGQLVEILQGLAENQELVAQGSGFLKDGDQVRVLSTAEAVQ
jgi:RND family efflux transporter MFP subunit